MDINGQNESAGTPPAVISTEGQTPPAAQAEDNSVVKDAGTPPADDQASAYSALISQYGETQLEKIYNDYEEVSTLLDDDVEMSKMTKEDLIQLYRIKNKLEADMEKITPIMEKNKKSKEDQLLGGIENPKVKEYITNMLPDLETPEDVEAFVTMVKELTALVSGPQSAPNNDPVNLKKDVSGGKVDNTNDVDGVHGMFSVDPEVRKKARVNMEKILSSLSYSGQ